MLVMMIIILIFIIKNILKILVLKQKKKDFTRMLSDLFFMDFSGFLQLCIITIEILLKKNIVILAQLTPNKMTNVKVLICNYLF